MFLLSDDARDNCVDYLEHNRNLTDYDVFDPPRQIGALFDFIRPFNPCDFSNIGGRLFALQPFSTERFELEGKFPGPKRFWGSFKFALP